MMDENEVTECWVFIGKGRQKNNKRNKLFCSYLFSQITIISKWIGNIHIV